MIEYMSGMHGFSPAKASFPASGALAKGVAVALNASGKLVLATGAAPAASMLGILEETATADGQMCLVTLCGPDALLRVTATGGTPIAGAKYDIAADGCSANVADVTDPKVKVLGLWPGCTTLYMAVNISFAL